MKEKETKITFSDYDEEGLFVYNLSKLENKNPYLICFLEENECYLKWDEDTYEYENEIWYEKNTKCLKEVARFEVDQFSYSRMHYMIFEVTDKAAYLNIWSKASFDYGITEYTISGNSNLKNVISSIKNHTYYDDNRLDYTLVPWMYTQKYGGGAGEHYAVFYSEEKKYIDFIRKQVEASKLSTITGC